MSYCPDLQDSRVVEGLCACIPIQLPLKDRENDPWTCAHPMGWSWGRQLLCLRNVLRVWRIPCCQSAKEATWPTLKPNAPSHVFITSLVFVLFPFPTNLFGLVLLLNNYDCHIYIYFSSLAALFLGSYLRLCLFFKQILCPYLHICISELTNNDTSHSTSFFKYFS